MRRDREERVNDQDILDWIATQQRVGKYDRHDTMQACLDAHSRFGASPHYRVVQKLLRGV